MLHHSHKSFYVEYLCITDVDEDSVVLQEGETSDYKWITADELLKLSRDELATQRILNFVEELNWQIPVCRFDFLYFYINRLI